MWEYPTCAENPQTFSLTSVKKGPWGPSLQLNFSEKTHPKLVRLNFWFMGTCFFFPAQCFREIVNTNKYIKSMVCFRTI